MRKTFFYAVIIVLVGILAWYKILSFWFFKGFEAGWLMGVPHDFVGLYRAHAFLYLLSFKLFGWNPVGWYAIALILHLFASLLVFQLARILTKSQTLGFFTALIFVANIAYEDVLTWGSFNAYYALILIWLLLAVLFFRRFRQTGKIFFLFLFLSVAFLAFFTRESSLVLLGVIPAFDFIFYRPQLKKQEIVNFVKRHLPLFLAAGIFLVIRSQIGGISGDYADDSVQLRLKLLKDNLYLPLIFRSGLTFSRELAALFVPYPLLNALRNFLHLRFPTELITLYFFPLVGWVVLCVLTVVTWLMRKNKNLSPILTFSLIWIIFNLALIGLAIPATNTVLSQDLLWNTRRHTYFAFFGGSLFLVIVFYIFYLSLSTRFLTARNFLKRIFILAFVAFISLQILGLWRIEDNLNRTIHRESRTFYKTFTNSFTTLPNNYLIYQYPHNEGLNDYLYEWSFLKGEFYNNLKKEPFRTENQLERVLEKIKNDGHQLSEVIFLDYSRQDGLKDQTKKAQESILSSKEFSFSSPPAGAEIKIDGGFPVEIPYQVEVSLSATPKSSTDFALATYAQDRFEFLNSASIWVRATLSSGSPGQPVLHLLPENLIDGNFGPRSSWIADSIPAEIIIDLGRNREIGAVFWSSQEDSIRIPSTYTFYTSQDNQNWQKVKEAKKNQQSQRIDVFEKPVNARFVKMVIETTKQGAFASLDEFEVIGAEALPAILSFGNDIKKLLAETQKIDGLNFGWARFSWQTNKTFLYTAPQEFYFPYILDGQFHTYTFQLPEREIFSQRGEFLNKFLTSVKIDFLETPNSVDIKYLKLKPKYKL